MAKMDKPELTPEEEKRKGRAKIRTLRIWLWVVALLFAGFFFLSQCALSKPKAKQAVVESCIKNIPFSEKWQADLQAKGLAGQSDKLIQGYCVCMWDEPLEKLTEKQIQSMSKMSAEEQLDLLGGAVAFEARDKQCVDGLKQK